MSRIEEALSIFEKDFNCAQSIFGTFAPYYGLDQDIALKIATGFGGGMGRSGRTCGAVTGAYMVIGLKHGLGLSNDSDAKDKTYQIVNEFSYRFLKKNGSMICKEIIGCDINTPEGLEFFRQNDLLDKKCRLCVKNAAEILEELLE
ncbi:MAG: C_GCAxxG_C_C family protein [Candidatus Lokiarchaeota archaeon]|nr:C_GCAxxG_C_C family protein [Candidatus Lokiarchaeota archaeon]